MVIPGLWQGSAPPIHRNPAVTADLLVLCAQEYQPSSRFFPRSKVIRARMDDAMPTPREMSEAMTAANEVVRAVLKGKVVLVTCAMGWNRSGLVTGLAMRKLGYSGKDAVRLIKQARGDSALSNRYFRKIVEEL